MVKKHTWKKQWEKYVEGNYVVRYYKYHKTGQDNLQLSKYRDADDFDRHMKQNYEWHGKWYVNIWHPEKTYLFDTKKEAMDFASKYMRSH